MAPVSGTLTSRLESTHAGERAPVAALDNYQALPCSAVFWTCACDNPTAQGGAGERFLRQLSVACQLQ